ncbi:MAG TPA: hypothetical protein VGA61_09260, partial [Anaerolineae bacterium]
MMSLTNLPILSIITLLPLAAALVVLLLRGEQAQKWWALIASLATFVISLALWVGWRNGEAGMQFQERMDWVPQFHIQYFMGVDGLSLFLVLLTTFLMVLVILFSWSGIKDRLQLYLFFML